MSDREAALAALYQSIKHRTTMTMDEFAHGIARFELNPIKDAGEVIGAVMIAENEIHVGLCRRPRTCHRGDLRRLLGALIARYGCARTAVRADNPAGLSFCKRLGFEEVHRDEVGVYLRCKGGPLYGHG